MKHIFHFLLLTKYKKKMKREKEHNCENHFGENPMIDKHKKIDLSQYATKQDLQNIEHPSMGGYVTQSDLQRATSSLVTGDTFARANQWNTEHIEALEQKVSDIKQYDIGSLQNSIQNIQHPDLSGFATKTEVSNLGTELETVKNSITPHLTSTEISNIIYDLLSPDDSHFDMYKVDFNWQNAKPTNANEENYDKKWKTRGFVRVNKVTKWGRIHVDFKPKKDLFYDKNDASKRLVGTLPADCPTPKAFLELQTHDGGSVYAYKGLRLVEANGTAGTRYIVDLWGYFG